MTTVSNIGIGAHLAGNAAAKARHGMNEAIARLSTGNRAMYGGDATGFAALKGYQGALYALAANSEAAASRLMDTDFAAMSAQLAKFSVLNQSAMAMVAQAN